MDLVIASSNLHKVRELREMFKQSLNKEPLSLHDFPSYLPVDDPQKEFRENASLKAVHAASALGLWVIADDSGLVIPALQPGDKKTVKRYQGSKETASENRRELLEKMQGLTHLERSAYFICCLAIAAPDGFKKGASAMCEGMILNSERGNGGFGFDGLFAKHDYDKSFGELDEALKNRISHRRKAFDKLLPFLESLLSNAERD